MSDIKFTHGPWEVVNTDDNLCMSMTVITPRGLFERNETHGMLSNEPSDKLGKIIAVTFHQLDPIVGFEACEKNEDDGNARLIAAAPEMYEALQKALKFIVNCREMDCFQVLSAGGNDISLDITHTICLALVKAKNGEKE